MFQPQRSGSNQLADHLWSVTGSVTLTVKYIRGSPKDAATMLLGASLVASSVRDQLLEHSL